MSDSDENYEVYFNSKSEGTVTKLDSHRKRKSAECRAENRSRIARSSQCSQSRDQRYRQEWEMKEEFKTWLTKSSNNNAFCKVCSQTIQSKLYTITRHAKSDKHTRAMKGYSGCNSINKFFKPNVPTLEEATKSAEIKFACALAEHNISFRFMDHLSDIIPSAFPDSAIAQKFSCKRTKTAALIYNVVSTQFRDETVCELRGVEGKPKKFSLIIDESTDISTHTNLAIVIKFYSEKSDRVMTHLLNLVEVQNTSAEGLFQALKHEISSQGLNLANMIGFAADTTNVMFGIHNSIVQKLKQVSPDCIFVKCVCHSISLAVSKACELLPKACEDIVRDSYSYFSCSSKRKKEFQEFQAFTETPEHQLLKLYDIRWLSLGSCVKRIIEQWEPLKLFFQGQYLNDRLTSSERLFNIFNNSFYKLYLLFLGHVLSITNKFNTIFQSQYSNIHNLYFDMSSAYKALLSMFMKTSYIKQTHVRSIDPESTPNYLELSDMYFGVQTSILLSKHFVESNKLEVRNFLMRCREFLICICKEIRKRLPFDDIIFEHVEFLNPQTAVNGTIPSLIPVLLHFPNLFPANISEYIDAEWRNIPFCERIANIVESDPHISPETFWGIVGKMKNDDAEFVFSNVAQLAFSILSVPVSNADCERIFSLVSLTKTKSRNRFNTDGVASLIITKKGLNGKCNVFDPSPEMLKKCNSNILYKNVDKAFGECESEMGE